MFSPAQALAFTTTATPWGAVWHAPLPAGHAGGWVALSVTTPPTACWIKLEFTDTARAQIVREVFLRAPTQRRGQHIRATLVHVPATAESLALNIFGDVPTTATLHINRSRRLATGLALLRAHWRKLPSTLRGNPLGLAGRARAVLGQAPARAGDVPPYTRWITLFEAIEPPPAPPYTPLAAALHATEGTAAERAASRAALANQSLAPTALHQPTDFRQLPPGWILLVAPGEILHPHALAWFAHTIARNPDAAFITADCDTLAADGRRADPLFKPGADPLLVQSGLLTGGACAINRPGSGGAPTTQALIDEIARAAGDAIIHIPRILTHRPPTTRVTVPAAPLPAAAPASITAIVPTQASARHTLRCIAAVQRQNTQPGLRILVALAQPDRAKQTILAALRRLPDITIISVPLVDFNYAKVNNNAAAAVDSDYLLLLNDDVAPITPDWLRHMLAHMADPRVGIVGARLLYGNGMVQHEGVILGLANLAEHAGRLRDGATPGPHGIGRITRQVSAVTAACLLIRTSLFRDLGGMDENYVIALNDVDLCLRARQRGFRVVYCAQAVLWHYESLSLGRHYRGARAGLEATETRRLRQFWPDAIAADPFYNPQASLQPGREWRTAFPPRGPGFPVTHGNLPAQS